jgi:hypothetical protein
MEGSLSQRRKADGQDVDLEPFYEHLRRKNPALLAELDAAAKRKRETKTKQPKTLDELCADERRPWASALLGVGPADMKRFVYSEIPEKDRRRAESMFLEVRCRVAGTIESAIRCERYLPYNDVTVYWVEVTLDDGDERKFVFRLPKSLRRLVASVDDLVGMPVRLVGTIKVDGRQKFPARLFSLKYPSNAERDLIIPRASKADDGPPDPEMPEPDEPEDALQQLIANVSAAALSEIVAGT